MVTFVVKGTRNFCKVNMLGAVASVAERFGTHVHLLPNDLEQRDVVVCSFMLSGVPVGNVAK